MRNADADTIRDFGQEWSRFDQSSLPEEDARAAFDAYFAIFPWGSLREDAEGFDLGCGSGRWAKRAAPRVGKLHCIDASQAALSVAERNLADLRNVQFHHASVADIPLPDASMDFGYSLGVLHHVPDTAAGISACVAKLKPGAPFLVYLYYAFDNRPQWFRALWRASDVGRRFISRLPDGPKNMLSDGIALGVYLPLARVAWGLERLGVNVESFPLSPYRSRSFYAMRTDALDRFGTRLEQRFTRDEVRAMMTRAGLTDVIVHDGMPYWTAVGHRASR